VAASHRNAKLLLTDLAHLALLHLECTVVLVDLEILHLALELLILSGKLLLLGNHAHVDILLVGCGDLLLLCLQHLDLLSERELLHWRDVLVWEGTTFGRACLSKLQIRGSDTYSSKASFRTGCDDGRCAGGGRRDLEVLSDFADPLCITAKLRRRCTVKQITCW